MKRKNAPKTILIFFFTFFFFSNGYILIKSPIIYTGGITDEEYESILFIKENLPITSYIFTDLRLTSILRTLININTITAYGYQLSTFSEINSTFYIFYSNDSFNAYYCLSKLFSNLKMGITDFYVLFSKKYVSEGFTTMDFSFGPIPLEAYNKYLNSTYFTVIFKNKQTFVVKANLIE